MSTDCETAATWAELAECEVTPLDDTQRMLCRCQEFNGRIREAWSTTKQLLDYVRKEDGEIDGRLFEERELCEAQCEMASALSRFNLVAFRVLHRMRMSDGASQGGQ